MLQQKVGVHRLVVTLFKLLTTELTSLKYGGVAAETDCSQLPAALQPGCEFRFGWFEGADNPNVNFEQVQCPTQLTQISGCTRDDDNTEPAFAGASGAAPPGLSSSAAPVAISSSAVAPVASSQAPTTTTSTPASGGSANAALQSQWGQCNGIGYTGPTSCSAPYTCQTQVRILEYR